MDEQKRDFLSMVQEIEQDEQQLRSPESFLHKLKDWLYDGKYTSTGVDKELKKRFLRIFKIYGCMKSTKTIYNSQIRELSLWPDNTKRFEAFSVMDILKWMESEEEKQIVGSYYLMNKAPSSDKWLEKEFFILYTSENNPTTLTECFSGAPLIAAFTDYKILQHMKTLCYPRIAEVSAFCDLEERVAEAKERSKFYYIGCSNENFEKFMGYLKSKTLKLKKQGNAGASISVYGLEEDSILYLDQKKGSSTQPLKTERDLLGDATTNFLCLNTQTGKDKALKYLYVITYNWCRVVKNVRIKSTHFEHLAEGMVRLGTRSVGRRTEIDIVICSLYSARCIASSSSTTGLLMWDGKEFSELMSHRSDILLTTTTQGYSDWLRNVDGSFAVIRKSEKAVPGLSADMSRITLHDQNSNDQNSTSRDRSQSEEPKESTKHGLITIAGPVEGVTVDGLDSEPSITVTTNSNLQLIFKLKSV